jgi:hypothetical protein
VSSPVRSQREAETLPSGPTLAGPAPERPLEVRTITPKPDGRGRVKTLVRSAESATTVGAAP